MTHTTPSNNPLSDIRIIKNRLSEHRAGKSANRLGRKLKKAFLLLLLLTGSIGADAQGRYEALPAEYDGSMMPYDFGRCEAAAVPDSLQPFFITYVARHGARFLSSEKKVSRLSDAIEKARQAGNLTPLGREFDGLIEIVKRHTDGRWGALDSVGACEQQELGRQMAETWPSVTKSGTVKARATYVPRVVMSMYEFAHSLGAVRQNLDIYTAEGHKFDSLLRYFTTDSIYVKYLKDKPWKKEYDHFVESHISARPAEALFGATFDEKENRKLTLELFGVIQSLRAAGLRAPDSRWMTAEEYHDCWEAANLEHYFARTDNPLSHIPVEGAVPLLQNMITGLEEAAAGCCESGSEIKAQLYFGHAETLMPLLSLCDVEGCNAPDAQPEDVAKVWKDYEVVPLGANFEIVLMRAPSGTVYALTRLNGRNVKVGSLPTPLVKWTQLKDFLNTRISRFK